MNTATRPMYRWQDLPWKRIERDVFKLQKRIYHASQRDDIPTVHKLQKLLINSWSARCLAVRRVTQDNRGKKTAGVDGVKSLTSVARLAMVDTLKLTAKSAPARRVWIPKSGKTEMRPLGIPVMQTRAEQSLAKLALEPEWEARFEPNSYGFRPGRSAHDAIEAIFNNISRQSKYVLDADIAKCFDQIDHTALLNKLATFPIMRRAVRGWLKAGVVDDGELFPTPKGSPQGGVASPLLANVALHGLEIVVAGKHDNAKVIRYADDLVVLHKELQVVQAAQETVSEWLKSVGLELKASKTSISHTLDEHQGKVGFDFLGFHVQQYRVGKTHSAKSSGRYPKLLGFKTYITPSKEAEKRHYRRIKEIIDKNPSTPQARLIGQLNQASRGWTAYYATVVSSRSFNRLGQLTFLKLMRWAKRRHSNKPRRWIVEKYWHPSRGKWVFSSPDGKSLFRHSQRRIRRHVKVRGNKSPFDGDWVYWAKRRAKRPNLPAQVSYLIRQQNSRCAHCGLYFTDEDKIEVDHIIPRSRGGDDTSNNRQLLHAHCHHKKSALDTQQRELELRLLRYG